MCCNLVLHIFDQWFLDEINTLEKKLETIKFIKGDALQEGLDQPMKIKDWYVYMDKLLSLRNPNNDMTYG